MDNDHEIKSYPHAGEDTKILRSAIMTDYLTDIILSIERLAAALMVSSSSTSGASFSRHARMFSSVIIFM